MHCPIWSLSVWSRVLVLLLFKIAATFLAVVLKTLLNHRVSSREYVTKFNHCANTLELAFVKHRAASSKQETLEKPFLSQRDGKTFVMRLAASHPRDLACLLKWMADLPSAARRAKVSLQVWQSSWWQLVAVCLCCAVHRVSPLVSAEQETGPVINEHWHT